ncbi:MAG TPA: hypothetical protein VHV10_02645 [Ktedonobacteraceae bacterium]|jgi:hypothetical protein|nr:hypothetical protein [Ktedonobacteraceae bacterium]
MHNITLTDAEAKLLIELLKLASDSFSNHGCNDFDLTKSVPALEDRRALMKSYNDYNGSPEDFEDDELHGSQHDFHIDSALMGYLTHRIEEQLAESPVSLADMKDANEAAWERDLSSAYECYNETDYHGDE